MDGQDRLADGMMRARLRWHGSGWTAAEEGALNITHHPPSPLTSSSQKRTDTDADHPARRTGPQNVTFSARGCTIRTASTELPADDHHRPGTNFELATLLQPSPRKGRSVDRRRRRNRLRKTPRDHKLSAERPCWPGYAEKVRAVALASFACHGHGGLPPPLPCQLGATSAAWQRRSRDWDRRLMGS